MKIFSYNKSCRPSLPERTQESNKGTYGRVLCVCGSYGMAGAAYLCAKAAYRVGAGLAEIFCCEENRIILQTLLPESVVTLYRSESPDTNLLRTVLERADAVVVGCGLGKSRGALRILETVLDFHASGTERSSHTPLVLDADALNLISENVNLRASMRGAVITPHPVEMSRLCGKSVNDIVGNIAGTAAEFATESGAICVLKDHRSAVSDGGERVYVNNTGNSGMSTGGSGDVLAGVIGGIMAQNARERRLSDFECAALGVYLHGMAGDIAAASLGEYSLMASDIINALPTAIREII